MLYPSIFIESCVDGKSVVGKGAQATGITAALRGWWSYGHSRIWNTSFQMKVNFAFHLEIEVPESGRRVERHWIQVAWSPVWSFHNQWWFWEPCHLLGPLCLSKSKFNAAVYKDILEHFMLPSAVKVYRDADFILQQDLAPAHTAKSTNTWFNDHGFTVLDWHEKLTYCQEEDERHQTQQCRRAEGCYQSNLGFHYTSAVPQADRLHATPHG